MKYRAFIFAWFGAFLLIMSPMVAVAAPITYYDLDFEDGTSGGGTAFPGFGEAMIIDSINLDGKALFFEVDDQMYWNRNDADSMTHYVAFDYYAEPGANVTQFLDIPDILRLDVSATGRHHIDVYYDLTNQQAWSFIDASLDMSLLTILVWSDPPSTAMIRIANQSAPPGYSEGIFEVDNLLWQGNVEVPVPEPATMLLLGCGLIGLAAFRRKFKKR